MPGDGMSISRRIKLMVRMTIEGRHRLSLHHWRDEYHGCLLYAHAVGAWCRWLGWRRCLSCISRWQESWRINALIYLDIIIALHWAFAIYACDISLSHLMPAASLGVIDAFGKMRMIYHMYSLIINNPGMHQQSVASWTLIKQKPNADESVVNNNITVRLHRCAIALSAVTANEAW